MANRMSYSFAGIDFTRVVSGNDFGQWFALQATYKADPILDSNQQYVDIGGIVPQPFQIRAAFATTVDRASMQDAIGSTGSLVKSSGESRSATLVAVAFLAPLGGAIIIADLTFVAN